MTLAETPRLETPRLAACPGCLAAPDTALPLPQGGAASAGEVIHLSLPSIHCAGCIATVERGLLAREEVHNARVNLNRKQVVITTRHGTSPEALMDHLTALGIEAHLLDLDALGQDGDRDGRALLIRIAIAGFAMMNVMLMSVAVWSGASDATRDLFHWLSAAITLPALAYAAQPFFRNAWVALRVGRLNMDVPISLALVLTAGMSVYETAAGGHAAYFDATLSLTCFLLIGRYLDHRCRANARSAAKELAALEVPRLLRKTATGRETINLSQARQGDHILVLPGARVPVDGMVIEGRSNLDRALLTGESLPVAADVGTMVSAGEVNLSGPLTLRATAVGADTSLRRMVTMIDAAESARNRYTALADRAAALYAPAVHLLAFATFLGWIAYAGDIRHALNIAVSVLIITCPCALGLAVPAVSTAAAGLLFRRGLLVKNGTALERIAETDVVVFDKTGTLTEGQLAVDAVNALPESALVVALALAQASTHPVSRALALGLETRGIAPAPLSEISETSGKGVQAIYKGQQVLLGAAGFVGVSVGASIGASVGSPGSESHGAWLCIGESAPIFLPLRASLRQGAARMIAQLQATGTEIHLISGDTPAATQAVASALGIPQARAGQSPADKIAYLDRLAASGRRVLMVGDGLNDTGALAAAYASVAPASAADAARAASDVVMLGQSLSALPDLINTARSAKRRILENFAIAAVYNALVIPFAMVGYVTPLVAAIAMSGSSIVVLLNAMRLQKGARA